MSEGIDLSKPPISSQTCVFCTVATFQTEPHKDDIEPGRYFLDLVHSDVIGQFQTAYSEVKYAVTFLDHFHQLAEVYFLRQKSDVLKAIQRSCAHHELGNN